MRTQWSAVVPVCAYTQEDKSSVARAVCQGKRDIQGNSCPPVWLFHAANDVVIPVGRPRPHVTCAALSSPAALALAERQALSSGVMAAEVTTSDAAIPGAAVCGRGSRMHDHSRRNDD